MDSRSPSSNERRLIEEDAARLLIEFDGDFTSAAGGAALAAWAARGPAHAVAIARVRASWRTSERLKAAPPAIEPEAVAGPAGRIEALFLRRHAAVISASLSLAAIVGIVAAQAVTSVDRYHTGIGERRLIVLADKSTMRLNTDSVAEVSIRDGRRHVQLLQGEAMFDVARDAHRPFVVDAASARLRAVGTQFNVRMRQDLVELTMMKGEVAVSEGSPGTVHTVAAGKLAAIRRGVVAESNLDAVDLQQRTAWRSDTIELTGTTLAQAIEEFNRYRQAPLVIGDPRIASIRVGGTFRTGDSGTFIAAVTRDFALRAIRGSDQSLILVAGK